MHGSPEVPVEIRPVFTVGPRSTNKVLSRTRRGRKRPDTTMRKAEKVNKPEAGNNKEAKKATKMKAKTAKT